MASVAATVFQCQELAATIFQCFDPGPLRDADFTTDRLHRRTNQLTLANAARVSRSWTDPALDVLWRVVDDVTSLLSLLPSFVNILDAYVFTHDPTIDEWEHFQQYARRVRELHFLPPPKARDSNSAENEITIAKRISPSVWTILSRRCGREGICPHLTYLSLLLTPSNPGQIVLISPTLRHLHISFGEYLDLTHTVALGSLLSCLLPVFASLESLRLGHKAPLDFYSEPTASFLVDRPHSDWLPALQSFTLLDDMITLAPSVLQTLASFNLRELNIGIEVFDVEENPSHTPGAFLPVLRKLTVRGPSGPTSRFVEYAAGSDLESLALIFDDVSFPSETMLLEDFARAARCLTQSARRFTAKFVSQVVDRLSPAFDINSIVFPLFPASNLTDISLRFIRMYTALHGETLQNITNAWPQLSKLHIEEEIIVHDGFNDLDLQDILNMVTRLPALRRLTLPYLNIDELPSLETLQLLNHNLATLRISTLPNRGYKEYLELALLLDRAFPDLDLCTAAMERNVDNAWNEVERILLPLQIGRRAASRT
ncbi:hypothetical protein C8Q78DRAFT_1082620 [Trametes maxima]|nr:hypothetical protein C8Q78DRAFT_1082620 [Trametes maxima]